MNQFHETVALGIQEFLDALKDSAVLAEDQFGRATKMVGDSSMDLQALSRWLVNDGILTDYQLDAVTKRDFAKLRIGNYEVLDRIGAGGMGAVFKARHRRMKRIVALKLLTLKLADDDSVVKRFQREVEAIAHLTHPNIVMAYDADESEAGHFLVMEFVNGRDLASDVAQRGPMRVSEAIDCVAQAARALDYAHNQGIVHRDIKPANLLRDANGTIKVTDLGLARFNDQFQQADKNASSLTQAGTIMGTVDFMSPEQALGQLDIDHRADVYSLGCTLYFLLTGKPPYQGANIMATLVQHREAPVPSLLAVRPTIPAELDVVFRRMAAKAPADRFQSMAEVVSALESIAATLGQGETVATETSFDLGEAPAASGATGFWEQPTTAAAPVANTIDLQPADTGTTLTQKVLLVEPSRTQSAIIRKYLVSHGVEHVVTAASGHDAIECVRREHPTVVISALHLPDITGVQLAQHIRETVPSAAPGFVLISSEAESSQAGSLSHCGRAILLHKPFTPEQLFDALKHVTSKSAAKSTRRSNQMHVLIVDDSAPARLHIRGVLQQLGFSQFAEAGDGANAIAAVAGGTFDFIVTDYNMPLMDGRGFVAYLRQNAATATTPIIMVTTETDPGKLDPVRQMNVTVCDKSFPRPVVEQFLREAVGVA